VADIRQDCLNRTDYEYTYGTPPGAFPNPYPGQTSSDDLVYGGGFDQTDSTAEHPFQALRKLLNEGNFYYSVDFDLTRRLQDRWVGLVTVLQSGADQVAEPKRTVRSTLRVWTKAFSGIRI